MNHQWITQVGVGGSFVALVLMLTFNYLKSRNNKKSPQMAGDMTVEAWEHRSTAIITTVMASSLLPVLGAHTVLLQDINKSLQGIAISLAEQRGREWTKP